MGAAGDENSAGSPGQVSCCLPCSGGYRGRRPGAREWGGAGWLCGRTQTTGRGGGGPRPRVTWAGWARRPLGTLLRGSWPCAPGKSDLVCLGEAWEALGSPGPEPSRTMLGGRGGDSGPVKGPRPAPRPRRHRGLRAGGGGVGSHRKGLLQMRGPGQRRGLPGRPRAAAPAGERRGGSAGAEFLISESVGGEWGGRCPLLPTPVSWNGPEVALPGQPCFLSGSFGNLIQTQERGPRGPPPGQTVSGSRSLPGPGPGPGAAGGPHPGDRAPKGRPPGREPATPPAGP